jgi:hypothetical protein
MQPDMAPRVMSFQEDIEEEIPESKLSPQRQ